MENHKEVLSCSTSRGITNLKRKGDHNFKPLLFMIAINTVMKNVGDQLHERTVYKIKKLYDEVRYKEDSICSTPISLPFIAGKNECDSPVYLAKPNTNTGPTITDPPTLEL